MKTIQNKWLYGFAVVTLVLIPLTQAQESEHIARKIEPTKLIESFPWAVSRLFQWPAESVLNGPNRVDKDAREVAWPKKQCLRWVKRVVASSWLPPKNVELTFIRNEFDERDAVRMAWERNGYSIQVSQTASLFTIKLTPLGSKNTNTGIDASQKLEKARQLCLQVFPERGQRWDQQGNAVLVRDLAKNITSYSFRLELTRHLKDDGSVYGRPQTMKEAGVKPPQNDVEASRENDPNNPNWDKTASSYHYWFRMVNWWNDGKSIGFYFLKLEGLGPWVPSYHGNIDKRFF